MNNLIDETLSKISKNYHSGLIEYLQRNLVYWPKVLKIEATINHAALEEDRKGLVKALDEYEGLFEEATRLFLRSVNAVAVPVRDISQIKTKKEVTNMRHHERFPPRFLSQEDFHKPRTLTIQSFGTEEIKSDDGPVDKFILYFEEIEDRGFVVNSINSQILEKLYGDDEDWIGKQIEVWTDPTVAFGKKVTGGLRLRQPSQPTPQDEKLL
jgi:hypothetical protein